MKRGKGKKKEEEGEERMGFDDKGSLTTVTNWEIGRPREKILSPFRHFGTGAGTQMQCGRNGVTDPARSCLEVPRTVSKVTEQQPRRDH